MKLINVKRIVVLLLVFITGFFQYYGNFQLFSKIELPPYRTHAQNLTVLKETLAQRTGNHCIDSTNRQITIPSNVVSHNNKSGSFPSTYFAVESDNTIKFSVPEGFRLPHPKAVKVTDGVNQPSWIHELKTILKVWKGQKNIIMVTANSGYKEILLNWLLWAVLTAGIPLKHILVVANDEPTWNLMQDKGMFSIFVPPPSLFDNSLAVSGFGQIMMARISVMRLLNLWGFNVAMIDTDALLLKDPWELFDQHPHRDIVASMGRFPSELSSQWGTSDPFV